jgi:hypothetical protein
MAAADAVINMVGVDAVTFEKTRASLRRGPFHFVRSSRPLPAEEVDLYVADAGALGDLAGTAVPIVAWGPAGMLRAAFCAGCADYLREPWTPEELSTRALAVLSRTEKRSAFPWGVLAFDGDTLRAPGGAVTLTHHEALILRTLLRSRGSPVPREALRLVSGRRAHSGGRSIDVQVASLRRKVRAVAPGAGRLISAVRGQGYVIP